MKTYTQKVNLTSSTLSEDKLAELYKILPEVFAENKIDFDKLRAVLGDNIQVGPEKFSFSWAGKSNAIKNVLVPSKLTLDPKPEESIKWDETENIFIEGDNLEVLKLLQKTYFEQVKMIYIDPPYNTGHDFVYNDDFSSPLDNYLKQTGQKSEDGNSNTTNKETNGRYHSDWLSMLYPRLKLAWNLLREDGVIFVSIDDNEVHHLRMVMDEVFGEENFVGQIIWEKRVTRENRRLISVRHDYILFYTKNHELMESALSLSEMDGDALARYKNPDNDPRGVWTSAPATAQAGHATRSQFYELTTPAGRKLNPPTGRCWLFTSERMNEEIQKNNIWFGSDGNGVPRIKKFLNEGRQGLTPETLWTAKFAGTNDSAKRSLKDLFDGLSVFDTPKPVTLIKKMLEVGSDKDSIILDFFAGSAPTAQAVLEKNTEDKGTRKFICVQIPEQTEQESEAFKAGYETISSISKERIRRVINGYGENPQSIDAGFKVFTLSESNYPENNFMLDAEKSQEENKKAIIDYLNKAKQSQLFNKENDTSIVYENIVKEGLSLNSKVEKVSIGKNNLYRVTDGEQQLLICLENKLASETVKELTDKTHKDKLFICLESSLDDTTAANLSLNLDLKTI